MYLVLNLSLDFKICVPSAPIIKSKSINLIFRPAPRFIKEAFEEYWSQEQAAVDYLFFDYLIEVARCEIPAISMFLKKVPNNNLHRDDLQAAMNQAIGSENFEQVIKSDTVLYKLSWRETYRLRTIDGSESIYQYFLNYHF